MAWRIFGAIGTFLSYLTGQSNPGQSNPYEANKGGVQMAEPDVVQQSESVITQQNVKPPHVGISVSFSPDQVNELLKKADDEDHFSSQMQLGFYFYSKVLAEKDPQRAKLLTERAKHYLEKVNEQGGNVDEYLKKLESFDWDSVKRMHEEIRSELLEKGIVQPPPEVEQHLRDEGFWDDKMVKPSPQEKIQEAAATLVSQVVKRSRPISSLNNPHATFSKAEYSTSSSPSDNNETNKNTTDASPSSLKRDL